MAATAKKTNRASGGERFAELAAHLRGMSEAEIELLILSSSNAAAFKNPKLVASYLFKLANGAKGSAAETPMDVSLQKNEQREGRGDGSGRPESGQAGPLRGLRM